jgi:uncharacterized protein YndB with AHSA1/START domain
MLPDLALIPDDRRLEIEREFDAPRDLVWKMFADPYHLSRWWGPKGFTNPVVELDLRPGGRWRHVMRSPDGRDFPTDSVFLEVTPPERIVYQNAAATDAVFGDNKPPSFLRVIELEALPGNRTRLTLNAYFDTAANKDAIIRRGFREGTLESFDRLEALLATSGDAP